MDCLALGSRSPKQPLPNRNDSWATFMLFAFTKINFIYFLNGPTVKSLNREFCFVLFFKKTLYLVTLKWKTSVTHHESKVSIKFKAVSRKFYIMAIAGRRFQSLLFIKK